MAIKCKFRSRMKSRSILSIMNPPEYKYTPIWSALKRFLAILFVKSLWYSQNTHTLRIFLVNFDFLPKSVKISKSSLFFSVNIRNSIENMFEHLKKLVSDCRGGGCIGTPPGRRTNMLCPIALKT